MQATRQSTTNNRMHGGEPEREKEVHVCCYDEGGFYFAADFSGFILSPFHEVGELCAYILECEREAMEARGHYLVIHAHKPAVMRPHPVWDDMD